MLFQTRMLSDVKELLRETAVREQEFMQEKKTLEEKVNNVDLIFIWILNLFLSPTHSLSLNYIFSSILVTSWIRNELDVWNVLLL